MGIFDFLRGNGSSRNSTATDLERDYGDSLSKLRDWVDRQSNSIKTCFAVIASPNDLAKLWSAYQKKVPNTEEDRRGREMAKKMGLPIDEVTPDLLIGNIYDVLQNRDNEKLPTNLSQWVDATVMQYRRNARASGMI